MIEPSNAERASWPDATRDYVQALEAHVALAVGVLRHQRTLTARVMSALMDTRKRDDLLLADEVHRADAKAREALAALSPQQKLEGRQTNGEGHCADPQAVQPPRALLEALSVIANASERSETMFGGKMSEVTRVFEHITRVARAAIAKAEPLASQGGDTEAQSPAGGETSADVGSASLTRDA